MTCQNCSCGCSNSNQKKQSNSKKNYYKSKPKSKHSHKKYPHRHCTCNEDIYIPDPYTNNCCDGPKIVGGSQGNVERVDCPCVNGNYY